MDQTATTVPDVGATDSTVPVRSPGPRLRTKIAAVAAATFLVGGVGGFAVGHATAGDAGRGAPGSGQAGPGGKRGAPPSGAPNRSSQRGGSATSSGSSS